MRIRNIKLNATAYIRRFVSKLEAGSMFATQDVLKHGSRMAVDRALSRMCAEGRIDRLAPGVYVKKASLLVHGIETPSYTPEEVAAAKTESFCSQIKAWQVQR